MAEGNKRKITFLGNDGVQDPEMIIDSDKNNDRKNAFREASFRFTVLGLYFWWSLAI